MIVGSVKHKYTNDEGYQLYNSRFYEQILCVLLAYR